MNALRFLLGATLLLAAAAPRAQSLSAPGGITVHYNAQPTLALTPEVARRHAITRSGARGLLNLAVRRARADGLTDALPARIEGSATNLAGQRQTLSLREVRDGDAIYYLAEPRIGTEETLAFELQVTPEGASAPILVRFRQEFHPPSR